MYSNNNINQGLLNTHYVLGSILNVLYTISPTIYPHSMGIYP